MKNQPTFRPDRRRSSLGSMGDVHGRVRDFFTRHGYGTTTLAPVARLHPDVMGLPVSRSNVYRLVGIENQRVLTGPLITPGDHLALIATPVRLPISQVVIAHMALGRQGTRGLVTGMSGYGRELYSAIVSGTF